MEPILKPGLNCQSVHAVEESGLLIDARAYYRAFHRAAGKARNYILLAGWQFDSDVRLVRGEDARNAEGPAGLLEYLAFLCERNPRLDVYVLAWDFSAIFAFDREWFQNMTFAWTSNGRISFLFDSVHPVGASHHQKFVVIDGRIGFVGGLDICAGHWDDRDHRADNPCRIDSNGLPHEPYHDIQAFMSGQAVLELVDIFVSRWALAGGEQLELPPPTDDRYDIEPSFSIPARRIAFSQTAARTILPLQEPVLEIRALFLDAIAAARELIYIESQYFSSQAIYRALIDRMKQKDEPKIQIIFILPRKMHAFFEELSLGLAQMKMLRSLQWAATETGHSLRIYWTAAEGAVTEGTQTYIHSKLLLVDDRFLSVGSANCTNRSMGLDTELNASWEAAEGGDDLARAIRRLRVNLLVEHTGLQRPSEYRTLYRRKELVATLDRLAASAGSRLQPFDPEYSLGESEWLKELGAENLPFDPEKPIVEENVFEHISNNGTSFFTRGILLLNEWLSGRTPDQ